MRIAIVGAGAIGGMIAALLAEAGYDPLLIARGNTLAVLQAHGIVFQEKDHRHVSHPRVTDHPETEGHQDLVIIAVKAHQIEAALPAILPLVGPKTTILTAINGLPWWFFQGWGGTHRGHTIHHVDPTGILAHSFDPDCIIGAAVYFASEVHPPFTVQSAGVRRLVLGWITDQPVGNLSDIADVFQSSGIPAPVADDIRTEVMNKLMGNLWANPLSVLTGATMEAMAADPMICDIGFRMMAEFSDLCAALSITLPNTIEKRLENAARLGPFRTSMLQDMDRNRQIELDAILGAVIEVAEMIDTPRETMRTAYALTRLRATTANCYSSPPSA